MARINSYSRVTNPADSDVFIIDSSTGSAGTRTVTWASIKAMFAQRNHTHSASEINSGTFSESILPTISIQKGGTGADNAEAARANLGVQNPIPNPQWLDSPDLNTFKTLGVFWGRDAKNGPAASDNGFALMVVKGAGPKIFQIIEIEGRVYTRFENTSTSWWDWYHLLFQKEAEYLHDISVSGRTITVTRGDNTTKSITTQDTTYSTASQLSNGLMSSGDKKKLDSLSTDYAGSIGLATSSRNGLLSSKDKAKLDSLSDDYAGSIGLVTTSRDGLMSASDKSTLGSLSSKINSISSISNSQIDSMFNL